jgi:hypothetical protein
MPNDATMIAAGKPKPEGAVFVAPLNSVLPTDASAALGNAFVCIGYSSEAGLTNSMSRTTSTIKAWGGDTVLTTQTESAESYKIKLIECLNPDTLKLVFGKDNVTESTNGLAIQHRLSQELEYLVWVFDMILGNRIKRVVIPQGKITEIGDTVYSDSEVIGYEITITPRPDPTGLTTWEYITKAL